MILPVGLVFLFFTCVKSRDVYNGLLGDQTAELDNGNTAGLMHIYKREALIQNGNSSEVKPLTNTNIQHVVQNQTIEIPQNDSPKKDNPIETKETLHEGLTEGGMGANKLLNNSAVIQNVTKTQTNVPVVDTTKGNNTKVNETDPAPKAASSSTNTTLTPKTSEADVTENSPGVVKRALIVFGGFTLMAIAYFIFYRKKKKYESANTNNTNDTNQFRYGVLQSEDRRDNLELSRIPLTMESDEDEDDLEIFDLEQKKKSLSYVNLQENDEDIVLNGSKDESKNNLLLDIEDGSSDTLINWSSNGNRSIL